MKKMNGYEENVGRPLVGLQGRNNEKSSFPIRRATRALPTFSTLRQHFQHCINIFNIASTFSTLRQHFQHCVNIFNNTSKIRTHR